MTTVTVAADGIFFELSLTEPYPNFATEARWINEKLLFIRVWWTRHTATDLIFDVELRREIFREMAHDGIMLFQQTPR